MEKEFNISEQASMYLYFNIFFLFFEVIISYLCLKEVSLFSEVVMNLLTLKLSLYKENKVFQLVFACFIKELANLKYKRKQCRNIFERYLGERPSFIIRKNVLFMWKIQGEHTFFP